MIHLTLCGSNAGRPLCDCDKESEKAKGAKFYHAVWAPKTVFPSPDLCPACKVAWDEIQDSIQKLVEQFREEYHRGFKDGANAARQTISGELAEVREYLCTLTDDDVPYAKCERMMKSVIAVQTK